MQPQWGQVLEQLISWTTNTNNSLRAGFTVMCMDSDKEQLRWMINTVANGIRDEYPFYADEIC